MTPPVDPNDVLMTGENSFIRLSSDGGKTLTDRFSHWRVLWCPDGAGHVLFAHSTLIDGQVRIYSDNQAVARWLQKTIETLLYPQFAETTLPITPAGRAPRGCAGRRRGPRRPLICPSRAGPGAPRAGRSYTRPPARPPCAGSGTGERDGNDVLRSHARSRAGGGRGRRPALDGSLPAAACVRESRVPGRAGGRAARGREVPSALRQV